MSSLQRHSCAISKRKLLWDISPSETTARAYLNGTTKAQQTMDL